jgi:hypothetical protein
MSLRLSHAPRSPRPHGRTLLALAAVGLVTVGLAGCGKKEEKPAPAAQRNGQEARGRQSLPEAMAGLVANPSAERRAKLVERIAGLAANETTPLGDKMVAVGLSPDFWTVDGKPAGVLVRNDGDQPLTPVIELGCYAPGGEAPKVSIDDGEGKIEFVFDPNGVRQQELSPVPPKSSRLYIVTTDRTWQAGAPDNRKLGVQILPVQVATQATAGTPSGDTPPAGAATATK